MKNYRTLAVLALAFVVSSTQTQAVPKECLPVLRIPPENYVAFPELLSPPQPIGYSTYYYELYGVFCQGKPEKDCIWACLPVGAKKASVKASF
jgi:hypothetical protein